MALWQALQGLNGELQAQVRQLYEEKFPRDIRRYLSEWIERRDWDSAALDESISRTHFDALLMHLQEQWGYCIQQNNVLQAPDFIGIRNYILKNFQNSPQNLAVILSECLKEEKRILSLANEMQGGNHPVLEPKWVELNNKIEELKRQTSEAQKEIKSLEGLNERLEYIQTMMQRRVEQDHGLAQSQAAMMQECQKGFNLSFQANESVLQRILNILKLGDQIVETLVSVELPEWKRRQQLACIGSPSDTSLDHLQKWFTGVAGVLQQIRQHLQKLRDQNSGVPDPIAHIENLTQSLLKKLLSNALVVAKQPVMTKWPHRPLILKTEVHFSVIVRFLANLPEFKCLLKVTPVFDKDVEEAQTLQGFRHFDLTPGKGKVLDEDVPGGGLVTEFGMMSVKENRKRAKGSNGRHQNHVCVTEELHLIKFVAKFQHAGLECDIEASSLPMVVITACNQMTSAWASVMWCAMSSTSEPWNLSLFVDPPPLTWSQLSQALSWQFLSIGQRELDENQLSMIHDKIVDNPEDIVDWTKFYKNENAWIWIDGILDLIRKHLFELWRDGCITGFVTKERTRELLQEKKTGTFLLRFSESSKDGAITFSWVQHSGGEAHVYAVEPYSKKELLTMSLPHTIYHYSLRAQKNTTRNPLLYLYPDTPKEDAFGCYYNPSEKVASKKVSDGYVWRFGQESVDPGPPSLSPQFLNMEPYMEVDIPDIEKLIQMLDDDIPPESSFSTPSFQEIPTS